MEYDPFGTFYDVRRHFMSKRAKCYDSRSSGTIALLHPFPCEEGEFLYSRDGQTFRKCQIKIVGDGYIGRDGTRTRFVVTLPTHHGDREVEMTQVDDTITSGGEVFTLNRYRRTIHESDIVPR